MKNRAYTAWIDGTTVWFSSFHRAGSRANAQDAADEWNRVHSGRRVTAGDVSLVMLGSI